jgi:hypothetical protein
VAPPVSELLPTRAIKKGAKTAGSVPRCQLEQFNDLVNRVEQIKETDAYGKPDKDVRIGSNKEVKPYLEKYTDSVTAERRMEKIPGRSTVDRGVKSSQRARRRKAAGDRISRSLHSGVVAITR